MNRYIIPFVVIILILILSFFLWYKNQKIVVNNVDSVKNVETIIPTENKKLDEIRNRENIKRQQELIVQEIYLSEEKDRINQEKEEAIKMFDAQIQEKEKQLEDIRAEKISFR